MLTKAPKGTKDILPDQIYKWQYVEKTFREVCDKYGFSEMRTPVFEHTELFKRGVGDTTDIVEKQMYTFEDFGKRSITLKPEGTSAIVRSFVEHKCYAGPQPSKYYYIIPCFRYEQPQSGRLREFHQLGIETFGSNSPLADAEVIAVAMDFFGRLGIKGLSLRINSIGCPECRAAYRKKLQDFLRPVYDQLCETCKGRFERNPMRILDCKSKECQSLIQGAPRILDSICENCKTSFEAVKHNLDLMGLDYVVDMDIVRGLDYYTKTAFEIVSDAIGAQGTVCGGGRYDNLISQIGGPEAPGVGFAMGIERLLLVMESDGAEIPAPKGLDIFIAVMGETAFDFGIQLMQKLRAENISVQMDLMERNLKGQFKAADRLNAKYTIVIGEDELAQKELALKNMETFEQTKIQLEDAVIQIKQYVEEK